MEVRSARPFPTIIQGGMGIAVSNWRLARSVARQGAIGIVSGTCIDTVLVRELQQGDPHGRLRVLADYPDPDIVAYLRERFYVPGGLPADAPYRLLPIHKFRPTVRSQRILSAAAYSEVMLAREGHDGYVGINLLCELKRFTLPCLYGAMLARVDGIFMGAGIPKEEAEQIALLAEGRPARLRLDVDTTQCETPEKAYYYSFNPADVVKPPPALPRPHFFPIIASDLLARILDKKLPSDLITGWVIEGPVAGGHNAPPRGKGRDADGHPVYDEKDVVNLDRVAALGYPFFLAGGYGTPEKHAEALARGAAGIQVGSLFSLCDESGYPAEFKRALIARIHRGEVRVRTDGHISPTGYPFKVLEAEDTLGLPELQKVRARICDLGYLQHAYLDAKGRLQGRCPSEPVDTYVAKGGERAATVGRGCLCNGLFANIGLGQRRAEGDERPLFTGGDALTALPLGSAEAPSYSAADVLRYLRGAAGDGQATPVPAATAVRSTATPR